MKYLMILVLLLPACASSRPLIPQKSPVRSRPLMSGVMEKCIPGRPKVDIGSLTFAEACNVWNRTDYKGHTFRSRLRARLISTAPWSDWMKKRVRDKKVAIGMNEWMVRAAWGEPRTVNQTLTTFGNYVHYHWGIGQTVMFRDGKAVNIRS